MDTSYINWTRGRVMGLTTAELSHLPMGEMQAIDALLGGPGDGDRPELRARIISAQVADLQMRRELPPCPRVCGICHASAIA